MLTLCLLVIISAMAWPQLEKLSAVNDSAKPPTSYALSGPKPESKP